MFKTREFLEDISGGLATVIAVGCGIAAGIVHLQHGTLQAPALLTTVGACTASFIYPVAPWRWGFLLTLAVPGAYVVAEAANMATSLPTVQRVDAVLAFGGPLASAYLGFGVARLVRSRPKPRAGTAA